MSQWSYRFNILVVGAVLTTLLVPAFQTSASAGTRSASTCDSGVIDEKVVLVYAWEVGLRNPATVEETRLRTLIPWLDGEWDLAAGPRATQAFDWLRETDAASAPRICELPLTALDDTNADGRWNDTEMIAAAQRAGYNRQSNRKYLIFANVRGDAVSCANQSSVACGGGSWAMAPYLTGQGNESTMSRTMVHEFLHTLGITHAQMDADPYEQCALADRTVDCMKNTFYSKQLATGGTHPDWQGGSLNVATSSYLTPIVTPSGSTDPTRCVNLTTWQEQGKPAELAWLQLVSYGGEHAVQWLDTPTRPRSVQLGPGHDRVNGSADTITGDLICGASGNDTINSSSGNDWVDGGAGNDTINAGDGNDLIWDGDGPDTIDGGPGYDTLFSCADVTVSGSGWYTDQVVNVEEVHWPDPGYCRGENQ